MFAVPWGKVSGRVALAGDVREVLAHGWDLAVATGQETELDQELGAFALAVAKPRCQRAVVMASRSGRSSRSRPVREPTHSSRPGWAGPAANADGRQASPAAAPSMLPG